jgi:MoaA/NifB/PqqE/SkfB family radical SAM enzyme
MGLNIGLQLTTRCNLRCTHCSVELKGEDLPLEVFLAAVRYAKTTCTDSLSFTGGEAILHPRFYEYVKILSDNALSFTLVSNGWAFPEFHARMRGLLHTLKAVYFSLDGARAETHDLNRGPDSYRRVLKAVSLCRAVQIPFGLQMVVTKSNIGELEEMALLASKVGAKTLGIGPLQPTPETVEKGLILYPEDLHLVLEEIARLKKVFSVPIEPGVGFFYKDPLAPCHPLNMKTLFLNSTGHAAFCCVLADFRSGGREDVIGSVLEHGFPEIHGRMIERVARLQQAKTRSLSEGGFGELDYVNCWYCLKYFGKVQWLRKSDNPWSEDLMRNKGRNPAVSALNRTG